MNNACDTDRIPPIEKIRRVRISLDTDHGTFEVDMPNLHDNAVSLEQHIQSSNWNPFGIPISRQMEIRLICHPVDYTLAYYPVPTPEEPEVTAENTELDEFLSEFERSDEYATET